MCAGLDPETTSDSDRSFTDTDDSESVVTREAVIGGSPALAAMLCPMHAGLIALVVTTALGAI